MVFTKPYKWTNEIFKINYNTIQVTTYSNLFETYLLNRKVLENILTNLNDYNS